MWRLAVVHTWKDEMACSDRPHGFGFIDLKRRHSHARREKGSPTRKPESLTQARLREQLSSATEYEAQRTLKWPLQSSNESAIRQCWQSFAIRGSVRRHKPCLFCTIQELAVCLWVRVSEHLSHVSFQRRWIIETGWKLYTCVSARRARRTS